MAWYEQATLRCLQQATALVVLTPGDVARRFAPSPETLGHREVAATACALERLAQRGLLLCRVVKEVLVDVIDVRKGCIKLII